MILDLETCQRLKDAGFPQDRWPQVVWWGSPRMEDGDVPGLDLMPDAPEDVWGFAAPDALDALDWFEREKGVRWHSYPQGHMEGQPDHTVGWARLWMTGMPKDGCYVEVYAPTAPGLIREIMSKLEAA